MNEKIQSPPRQGPARQRIPEGQLAVDVPGLIGALVSGATGEHLLPEGHRTTVLAAESDTGELGPLEVPAFVDPAYDLASWVNSGANNAGSKNTGEHLAPSFGGEDTTGRVQAIGSQPNRGKPVPVSVIPFGGEEIAGVHTLTYDQPSIFGSFVNAMGLGPRRSSGAQEAVDVLPGMPNLPTAKRPVYAETTDPKSDASWTDTPEAGGSREKMSSRKIGLLARIASQQDLRAKQRTAEAVLAKADEQQNRLVLARDAADTRRALQENRQKLRAERQEQLKHRREYREAVALKAVTEIKVGTEYPLAARRAKMAGGVALAAVMIAAPIVQPIDRLFIPESIPAVASMPDTGEGSTSLLYDQPPANGVLPKTESAAKTAEDNSHPETNNASLDSQPVTVDVIEGSNYGPTYVVRDYLASMGEGSVPQEVLANISEVMYKKFGDTLFRGGSIAVRYDPVAGEPRIIGYGEAVISDAQQVAIIQEYLRIQKLHEQARADSDEPLEASFSG